jgi:hypothetical protein
MGRNKMCLKYFNFPEDKNLDDFKILSKNLNKECEFSRADVVDYLIERCKRSENKIKLLERVIKDIK